MASWLLKPDTCQIPGNHPFGAQTALWMVEGWAPKSHCPRGPLPLYKSAGGRVSEMTKIMPGVVVGCMPHCIVCSGYPAG